MINDKPRHLLGLSIGNVKTFVRSISSIVALPSLKDVSRIIVA